MFNILLMDRSSGIQSEKSILLISIYYECNRDLIAHSNKISGTIAQEKRGDHLNQTLSNLRWGRERKNEKHIFIWNMFQNTKEIVTN